MSELPRLSEVEESRLAWLNDQWGVSRWERQADGLLVVELDDGDFVEVYEDGDYEVRP